MAAVKQERILEEGPEIVVATPGRLWELIQSGNSHLSQLDSLRLVPFYLYRYHTIYLKIQIFSYRRNRQNVRKRSLSGITSYIAKIEC